MMKTIIFLQNVLIILLGFCLTFCNNSPREEKGKAGEESYSDTATDSGSEDYPSVEIYCWGFESNDFGNVSGCTSSGGRILPAILVHPSALYASFKNEDSVKNFHHLIYEKKDNEVGGVTEGPDTRFILLFKKDYQLVDTVVFSGDKEIVVNDKYLFKYSFDIMDSIRVLLKTKEINCNCSNRAPFSIDRIIGNE